MTAPLRISTIRSSVRLQAALSLWLLLVIGATQLIAAVHDADVETHLGGASCELCLVLRACDNFTPQTLALAQLSRPLEQIAAPALPTATSAASSSAYLSRAPPAADNV